MTTTLGIFGGEPRTFAIVETFHRGRASIGINPPVPVLLALDALLGIPDVLVKDEICTKDDLEEEEAIIDTERFRGVGVERRLSLLWGGREVSLLPERIDDPLDEVCTCEETAP